MNTIELLEDWNNEHKSHIDNGYGATCWVVKLYGRRNPEHTFVHAQEVSFWEGEYDKSPPNYTFVEDGDAGSDWAGLEKTILAGIKLAKELGI